MAKPCPIHPHVLSAFTGPATVHLPLLPFWRVGGLHVPRHPYLLGGGLGGGLPAPLRCVTPPPFCAPAHHSPPCLPGHWVPGTVSPAIDGVPRQPNTWFTVRSFHCCSPATMLPLSTGPFCTFPGHFDFCLGSWEEDFHFCLPWRTHSPQQFWRVPASCCPPACCRSAVSWVTTITTGRLPTCPALLCV